MSFNEKIYQKNIRRVKNPRFLMQIAYQVLATLLCYIKQFNYTVSAKYINEILHINIS